MSVSTADLRKHNREAVLKTLARSGSATRQQLANSTHLTVAAISRITRQLIDSGLVVETGTIEEPTNRGRRTQALALSDNGAWLIVMVITANRRAVALVNGRGEIHAQHELDGLRLNPAAKALDVFCGKACELLAQSNVDSTRVLGVSIVVAVNTNPADAGQISSAVLKWNKVPVASLVGNQLQLPVHLEARAVALLQTELWQRPATPDSCVILVNNGWRIATSAFLDGRLLESSHGRLAQLAHFPIQSSNTLCYCGQMGCLDALASGAAVVGRLEKDDPALFHKRMTPDQKLDKAVELSHHHRSVANEFRRAGEFLGQGLNALQVLYAPERILLAGMTCRQSDYLKGVKNVLNQDTGDGSRSTVHTCTISSIDAAIRTGLDAFLFSDSLDINRFAQATLS